ncbi:MAG: zinc ribbon domain-containing protein [Prevotella sp.]|jgi:uncharacterized membrane protein|nr:zinc ribbon domain-containing protein [Prevotella sp.]
MSQETNFEDKFSELNNTKDSTSEFSQQDINSNKVMAILAYLGILVLVPIFAAKDSKFARFHANQGLVLFLAEIAFYIVLTIVSAIILAISWKLYFIITILSLVWIVFLVLAIIGIINAANGKAKELPVIGKFTLLK